MATNRIDQVQTTEFFAHPSLLPVASKCNFTILRLQSTVQVDISKRSATWTKNYSLKKVASAHSGNDQWFEVTGCPAGDLRNATEDNVGFAFESLRDNRDNVVHRIDFGRVIHMEEEVSLTIEFVTSSLESENKLIDIASEWPFFQSMFFRFDQGYSVPCSALELEIRVTGGRISGAWPNALCSARTSTAVHFKKVDLRPYEVVTPFVHVEKGSRRNARIAQGIGTFILGVGASYVAGLLH